MTIGRRPLLRGLSPTLRCPVDILFGKPLVMNVSATTSCVGWCPGTELNRRHEDFQSSALPTELPGRTKLGESTHQQIHCPRHDADLFTETTHKVGGSPQSVAQYAQSCRLQPLQQDQVKW
jgi:hypothetical protein